MASPVLMPQRPFPLRAGMLRQQVQLQQRSGIAGGGFNDPQPTWTAVATVWALVQAMIGDDIHVGPAVTGKRKVRVRMRYYAGFDTSWRIVYGTRIFTPAAVIDPDERHVQMDVLCWEGTP